MMIAQKFFGATSREVLRKVRLALGDDAMIVANSPVANGVEVTALAARAFAGAQPERAEKIPAPATDNETGMMRQMRGEFTSLKATLQRELSAISWSELRHRAPARASAVQSLLIAGFSPQLTRELAALLPAEAADETAARNMINAELGGRLQLAEPDELVEQGGVYALIGPTGVGKTTTLAKLAARCVVRRGADSLVLLTTDSYRIAAHDQLRIYGRILGVPVHAIKDAPDLKATLAELRDKHTVLIDTTGMNQRDHMVTEQHALLTAGGRIKRVLLLNATTNAATLDEVVHCYARQGVHGCIVTKIDESASVGAVVDSIIRHRLTLHYITDGQRVPEDVHLPDRDYLLDRALQATPQEAPGALQAEETCFLMAGEQGVAHA